MSERLPGGFRMFLQSFGPWTGRSFQQPVIKSITLSRDIPFGMGKVLGPILHNVPAESLRSSLAKTRSAVSGSAEHKAD